MLTFTHDEAGSSGKPPLCSPNQLPGVREREMRCVCATLGSQPPQLLDYADGHLQEAGAERMIAQILSVAREVRPQVWLSFGPDGLSEHPDHIAVGQWAFEVFLRAEEIAALYTVAVPRSLPLTYSVEALRAALSGGSWSTAALDLGALAAFSVILFGLPCTPWHGASNDGRQHVDREI